MPTHSHHLIDESFLASLLDPSTSTLQLDAQHTELVRATRDTWTTLLERIAARARAMTTHHGGLARLASTFLRWMQTEVRHAPDQPICDDRLLREIRNFYGVLAHFQLPRHDLLTAVAVDGSTPALQLFGDLLQHNPPRGIVATTAPIAALFHSRRAHPEQLFPGLLECLANVELAPAILDLANYLTRHHRLPQHPASDRTASLIRLLEGLVAGLERIQTNTRHGANMNPEIQHQLSNSIALVISLCDALALIGDSQALASLERVAQLQHRRLRVEALAAMARLGDMDAGTALVALAAEPAVRLRVLAYADELRLSTQIDEQFKAPVALAEAELVSFLAGPARFGVPPTSCELIDSCTQYWPGYDEPQMCYLFRYSYRVASLDNATGSERPNPSQVPTPARETSSYSNVGIAGPLVQALQADLCDLSAADIYAVYAGWHAEHEEIYEVDCRAATDAQRQLIQSWCHDLEHEEYQHVEPIFLAYFFGDSVLVARARLLGVAGTVIVDGQGVSWHPHLQVGHTLGSTEFYYLYKGRRLLRTFNVDA